MTEKVTFSRQGELLKLPVPTLQESCDRYLRSLEALQTPTEHENTKRVTEAFLKNEGPRMQAELEEYAKTHKSYIEEFWDESYLLGNDSVVLNLNPFFILEDEPDRERGSQLWRAATLTLETLRFVHDLRHEVLKPDDFRGKPLDMFQYTRLFGVARIPASHGCYLEQHEESRHMVVMRRGQFYWFEVLDLEHRPLMTEQALVATLRSIISDADQLPADQRAHEALGALSTEKRRTWYQCRNELMAHPINRKYISIIDSALFVLCLDDNAPEDTSSLTQNMLCGSYKLENHIQVGTCLNRWYDKLQIIVCANGKAGINFEHSSADGHTVLRYVADIYTESLLEFARSIHPATPSLLKAQLSPHALGMKRKPGSQSLNGLELNNVRTRTAPKRFMWDWSPYVLDSIRHAEMRLSDLICQNEALVLEFKGYGKHFITKHGFSPDAFVQMAFQATYYELYGRLAPSYEPAMTKAFLRGRTETIRTAQPHTLAFVKAWYDAGVSTQDKLMELRKACVGHVKLSKEAASGYGFDRHLYALKSLFERLHPEEPLPEFFTEGGYDHLNHVVMSTSNCGNPALRIFGFGPVVQDGFGFGYIIQDNKVTVCASSKHLQTRRFLNVLERYLYEVQAEVIRYVISALTRSAYKAANIMTTRTYIDHSGIECDVRTGLPVGTHHQRQKSSTSQAVGASGYVGTTLTGQLLLLWRRETRNKR